MCGLAGVFGSEVDEDCLEMFRHVASLSSLRGEHSTGVADFQRDVHNKRFTEVTVKKTVEPSNDFFSPRGTWDTNIRWDKYYNKKNIFCAPTVVMAHARHATIGKISKENAHPFVAGKIVGAHNGTIRTPFEGRDKYDTDSEAVFNHIKEKGAKETIEMLQGLHSAAFALTWINTADRTFNICRNKERPLYFIKVVGKDICFYASDRIFLSAVAPYYGINTDPEIVPINTLYTYDIDAFNVYNSRVQEVIPEKPFFPSRQAPWERDNPKHGTNTSNTTKTDTGTVKKIIQSSAYSSFKPWPVSMCKETERTFIQSSNVTHIKHIPLYQTGETMYVGEETYTALLKKGCRCCTNVASIEDKVYFLQDNASYLCDFCIDDPQCVEFAWREVESEFADDYKKKLNDPLPKDMLPESNTTSTSVH